MLIYKRFCKIKISLYKNLYKLRENNNLKEHKIIKRKSKIFY